MNRAVACKGHQLSTMLPYMRQVRALTTSVVRGSYARSVTVEEKLHKDATTPSSKDKWMDVRWKTHHPVERQIKYYAKDESYRSDPEEARRISNEKMERLKLSLISRGFCREMEPYKPPKDVESRIEHVCKEVFGTVPTDDFYGIALNDPVFKFKFLTLCAARFKHEVPNSDLHAMRIVGDVVQFYLTPIRGVNTYDHLARNQDDLPLNLHIIPEVKRYDPDEKDNFFKGVDAFPGGVDRIQGLRAQKKYPVHKTQFKWPDI